MADKKVEETKKPSRSFREFMAERRTVDRWFVIKIALAGAFAGALLMSAMSLIGLTWP